MKTLKNYKNYLNIQNILIIFLCLILLSRFLFLDFGLPLIQQADEIELVEYPLNYSVNFKKLFEGDFAFFKPFSFVYGTFPTYLNTLLLIPFLKFTSTFSLSQDRYCIYLYLRVIYCLFSIISCLGVYLVSKKLINDNLNSIIATIIFSLNINYLWLSKYLNNDNLIILFTIWFTYFYLKFKETIKIKYLYISIFFIALGISTKITYLILLLIPFIDLVYQKKFKELFLSIFLIAIVYLFTNPFTFIYPQEFLNRILEMRVKENGIVIDSYNTSPFKYIYSLYSNLGILVLIFGFIKIYFDCKEKKYEFTTSILLLFLIFFSLSSRLVDRWLIPIYFILIINFLIVISKIHQNLLQKILLFYILIIFSIKFVLANIELSYGDPMKNSYLDFRKNYYLPGKSIYVVTEKGLNPYISLGKKEMLYFQAPVVLYESESAFQSFPDNPKKYDFIVFSSKVRDYYSNPYIYKLNPEYTKKWESFFEELNVREDFDLVGFYGMPNNSILNLEKIYIFRKK